VAAKLGLKGKWTEGGKAMVLADGERRLEVEADSRECMVNGLRVYLGDPVSSRRGTLHVTETDFEDCLLPLLRPALIARRPPRPRLVAIDAGHGGNDQGTENTRLGLKEKVFTLDVALRLKQLLEARGYRTVLTRDADERVENPQRALIARHAGADLFVSIHFNSLFPDTKTTGAEVFTFTRAGQRSDSSRGFGQPDDTEDEGAPVNRHDPWSSVLAHALHRHTLAALHLPDRGQKTKHLGMLRSLDCPAALVESGFLSNEEEARKIATPAYRQKIAEALADAIDEYSRIAGGK
jgi:N-acetylmuramoyl-L-alanine amidase